mmetsp:Transcript_52467/g.105147  ORF Transcript_52467/g.105147 Transcript_52467/m.105147 type:complete len:324 (-) Transcript_52467:200-1171(-)
MQSSTHHIIVTVTAAATSMLVVVLLWKKRIGTASSSPNSLSLLRAERGSTVAITGSAGFLGGIAREAAKELGCHVVGVDLPSPRSQFVEHAARSDLVDVECDLSLGQVSIDQLAKALRETGAHTVIHLAGDGRPSANIHDLVSANIIGTHTVLQASADAGCVKRVVFASSNHAFLGPRTRASECGTLEQRLPLMEVEDAGAPDSLYGVSKVCGESLLRLFSVTNKEFDGIAMRIGWAQFDDPAKALPEGASESQIAYLRAIWLSRRDTKGFFKATIQLPPLDKNRRFLSFWATSKNTRGVFNLDGSSSLIGYSPRDNSENFFD